MEDVLMEDVLMEGARVAYDAAMEWILAGFVILALAAAAVIGSGRWGAMPPVVDDRFPGWVPAGELDAADVRDVCFSVVPRGYSMAQVDALLARLADQIERPDTTTSTAQAPAGGEPMSGASSAMPSGASSVTSSGVTDRGEHRSL